MKVYITKYALTKGILEKEEAEVCKDTSLDMISVHSRYTEYYHKPDWHESKEEAIEQAEKMRERKIKNLEKQINKLKNLSFN